MQGQRRKSRDIQPNPAGLFIGGFTLAALHPSSLAFFVAFTPQFIDLGQSFAKQAMVMTATFLLIGVVTGITWLFVFDSIRSRLLKPEQLEKAQLVNGYLVLVLALIFGSVAIYDLSSQPSRTFSYAPMGVMSSTVITTGPADVSRVSTSPD